MHRPINFGPYLTPKTAASILSYSKIMKITHNKKNNPLFYNKKSSRMNHATAQICVFCINYSASFCTT